VKLQISATYWLVLATMAVNLFYDVAHLVLHPISTVIGSFVLRLMLCLLVCLVVNWARMLYVIVVALSILMDAAALLSSYVVNNAQMAPSRGDMDNLSHPTALLVLTGLHIPLAMGTLWVLSFSESVREFFDLNKGQNSL